MSPRAPSRDVNCCVMEMPYLLTFFTSHSGTTQAGRISEADRVYDYGLCSGRLTEPFSGVIRVKLSFPANVTDTKLIKKHTTLPTFKHLLHASPSHLFPTCL